MFATPPVPYESFIFMWKHIKLSSSSGSSRKISIHTKPMVMTWPDCAGSDCCCCCHHLVRTSFQIKRQRMHELASTISQELVLAIWVGVVMVFAIAQQNCSNCFGEPIWKPSTMLFGSLWNPVFRLKTYRQSLPLSFSCLFLDAATTTSATLFPLQWRRRPLFTLLHRIALCFVLYDCVGIHFLSAEIPKTER